MQHTVVACRVAKPSPSRVACDPALHPKANMAAAMVADATGHSCRWHGGLCALTRHRGSTGDNEQLSIIMQSRLLGLLSKRATAAVRRTCAPAVAAVCMLCTIVRGWRADRRAFVAARGGDEVAAIVRQGAARRERGASPRRQRGVRAEARRQRVLTHDAPPGRGQLRQLLRVPQRRVRPAHLPRPAHGATVLL